MRRSVYAGKNQVLAGLRCLARLGFALSVGCEPFQSSPNLLDVTDLSPRALEVGDRLTLNGSGFPEGRPAKLNFHGDVFRPGQSPLRDVTIVATAAVTEPHSISVTVSAELAREFCGAGDAVHATFRGATSASFAARESGAPAVRGTLEGVVLDVNPVSISKTALAAHEAEATRFAEFAGMVVARSEERDVLLVDSLDPAGRAARAGLLPGDALLELDGLRLTGASDLIPPPRARLSHVNVRRGDETAPATFALDVAGFQPGSPSELVPAATLLGFAVAALLLLTSPLGRALCWFEAQLATRLRDSDKPPFYRSARQGLEPLGFARTLLRELPTSPLPYFVLIADSAWLTLLAMRRTIWARELDLPALFLGSLTALCATALVVGGRERGRRFSLPRGLRHVLSCALFQSPVLVAMACAVMLSGSLRSDDILAAQGGWPWQWFAFSSPMSLAVLVLLLLGLVPVLSRTPGALRAALADSATTEQRQARTTLAEWSHLILVSGVISLVFLGGPRVPGFAASDEAAGAWLQVTAALLFQAKAILVMSCVLVLRFATGQVRVEEVAKLGVQYALPGAAFLLMANYIWAFAGQSPLIAAARVSLGYGLFFLCGLCLVHVVVRVSRHAAGDRPRSTVNPWL